MKIIKPKVKNRKVFIHINNEIKTFPLPATDEIVKLKSVQYFLTRGILEIVETVSQEKRQKVRQKKIKQNQKQKETEKEK